MDPLIINSSQVVDVSHWNTDFVKVLAIGGGGGWGGGGVMNLKLFAINNSAAAAVFVSVLTVFVIVIPY